MISWILFLVLCMIWGSSFILMKLGLNALSPYQVATIRILSAGLVLLPFSYKAFTNVPRKTWPYVILSGVLGSFIPAFLYCIAETRIDSSLAAIFNSLTPLCTIIAGILFFKLKTRPQKITGVLIGLIGLVLLPFASGKGVDLKDISFSALVVAATISYAFNVNIAAKHLHLTGSANIAALAFSFLLIPCIIILIATGYFKNIAAIDSAKIYSTLAAVVLGVCGTALANILFYSLVKKAGAVFSSLVTYGIPFIAVIWGLLYSESVTFAEIGCLLIILGGVYIVNRR